MKPLSAAHCRTQHRWRQGRVEREKRDFSLQKTVTMKDTWPPNLNLQPVVDIRVAVMIECCGFEGRRERGREVRQRWMLLHAARKNGELDLEWERVDAFGKRISSACHGYMRRREEFLGDLEELTPHGCKLRSKAMLLNVN